MSVEIVAVIPVLGRPERVAPLFDSFFSVARVDSELVFITSPGDEAELEAIRTVRATSFEVPTLPGAGDFAIKTNLGARWSRVPWPESRFVFAGADDLVFHDCWDECALEVAEETGASVIGVRDGWNPMVERGHHSTHSLVRRSYVDDPGASWDGPGSVYSEAYDHQWVDNELVFLAKSRGAWAFSPGSLVEHLHPFAGKSSIDATYEKALARGREDHVLFEERRRKFA